MKNLFIFILIGLSWERTEMKSQSEIASKMLTAIKQYKLAIIKEQERKLGEIENLMDGQLFDDNEQQNYDLINEISGSEQITQNMEVVSSWFDDFQQQASDISEKVLKQLEVLKEAIAQPNQKYMGIHPGTNYPYAVNTTKNLRELRDQPQLI